MLHYTFTRFSDLKARRDRCDCAPTEEDAKRCFILPFDRMVRDSAAVQGIRSICRWLACPHTAIICGVCCSGKSAFRLTPLVGNSIA